LSDFDENNNASSKGPLPMSGLLEIKQRQDNKEQKKNNIEQ
jgi:hypothetical protein